MFTMPGLDINVTAPPFLFSECQLRVLAIGGGSEADSGGGGSGNIQCFSETLITDTTDGYSGGGGYGNNSGCDGGSDGSDGEDCSYGEGGHGTGDDVTAYKMENFVLTPGAGGNYYYTGWYYGGGGGVLVNGEGQQQDSLNQVEGYGGGGGYRRVSGVTHGYGLPGVILMEVEEH